MTNISEIHELSEFDRDDASTAQFLIETLNAIEQGVAVWDAARRLVAWNQTFQDVYGFREGFLFEGIPLSEILAERAREGLFGPGAPEVLAQKRLHEIENQDVNPVEEKQYRDGRCIEVRQYPLPAGGYVSVFTDLMERRQAERELNEYRTHLEELVRVRTSELVDARDLANQTSQAKSDFLSAMSHEIRTPMNAILGFAQLLENHPDDELTLSQRDSVETVLSAGQHLLALIDDILDLAKIESGRFEMHPEEFAPREAFEQCVAFVRPLADRRGVDIVDQTGESDLGRIRVDNTRFRQALVNLLSNAIKYNRPGGTVTLSARRTEANRLCVEVRDCGRGIPKHLFDELFLPFSRLGEEFGSVDGTGIGLSITKEIVEAMGGDIGVESVVGEGSTFWIEFDMLSEPLATDEVTEEKAPTGDETNPEETPPADSNTPSQVSNEEPYRIVYVEDNDANRLLMERVIGEQYQFSLETTVTAEEGLKLIFANVPDVILLDINLLGMDGYEALKCLQADPRTAHVPVLAITARAMPEEIERGLEAGFRHYLTKPLNLLGLFEAIFDVLNNPRSD
ncbi:MAG: response regulator [Rhodospirillaceae bacterium]|jgi:signal transduction histidine kinase/CheY-like chemotaxis protein|nr:response regulator [Rhodospirillaceae bacterium]